MIKKISTQLLVPGMYIHDLNSSWVHHPFLKNRFLIATNSQISKIHASGIADVYIDTDKGLDTEEAVPEHVVKEELKQELQRVIEKKVSSKRRISTAEEMVAAQNALSAAKRTVKNILIESRMGKQVDLEKANHAVSGLAKSIFRNKDALLSLNLIRHRDQYTFEHSVSVAVLLIAFGKDLGLEDEEIHKLGVGGLLHDIGKTMIPDEILNKPGQLTEKEFATMQKHVTYGSCILSGYGGIHDDSIIVTCQHHERMDGTGYPDKLEGDQISYYGQMAAIADVYDAIVSDRCYHQGAPPTSVLRKLLEWSKTHFNEELVKHFIHCVGIYPVGTLVRLESGNIAVVIEQGERDLLCPLLKVVYSSKKQSHISPYFLDLASPPRDGTADKIVAYENPRRWGIQPFRHLGQ